MREKIILHIEAKRTLNSGCLRGRVRSEEEEYQQQQRKIKIISMRETINGIKAA